MLVIVLLFMRMRMAMRAGFAMVMLVIFQMHIEFDTAYLCLLAAGGVKMVTLEPELFQFAAEPVGVHAQINECADEHIAADAAEDIEVKGFHRDQDRAASSLIWEAA